jgi:hypothetical protein
LFAGYGKFKGQVLNASDVECLYEGLKENNIYNFTQQHYMIKFVKDLWQVGGFLQVL